LKAKVGKNIAYLSLVQTANYLFPLITVPHISRAIGVPKYGLVEFAMMSVIYFTALVDFSFDVSGTRKMARVRHRPGQVNLLFNSILFAKLGLFILASLLFLVLLFAVPAFKNQQSLLAAAYLINLSYVFYPNWLFQGLEKLGVIAIANFGIKLLFTLLIFTLVRDESDYVWVPLSNSIGYIVVALVVFAYAFKQVPGLHIQFPGFRAMAAVLKDGVALFFSNLLNKLYALSGITIAGLYLSNDPLGHFGAANKLYMVMLSMMFYPLHGAIFPHLNATLQKSKADYFTVFKKLGRTIFGIYAVGLAVLYFVAPYIVTLLFGAAFTEATTLFRLLIPALFAGIFIHLFTTQGLLTLKFDRWYFNYMLVVAFVAIVGGIVSVRLYGITGIVVFKSIMDACMAIASGWLFIKAWSITKKRA
jgi:polysaccharide transporter, PST family